MSTYAASARFKSGDGRLGQARPEADIPVGEAGYQGDFADLQLGNDIPAFMRKGAREALGGQLDFSGGISTLRGEGVDIRRVGRYVMSVVDFRNGALRGTERPNFLGLEL